jgi:hypothetical protein
MPETGRRLRVISILVQLHHADDALQLRLGFLDVGYGDGHVGGERGDPCPALGELALPVYAHEGISAVRPMSIKESSMSG